MGWNHQPESAADFQGLYIWKSVNGGKPGCTSKWVYTIPTSKVQDSCIFGTKKHVGETSKLLGDPSTPWWTKVCASVPGCDVQKRARTLDRAEAAFAQHRNRMQVAGQFPVGRLKGRGGNKLGENNGGRWLKFVEIKNYKSTVQRKNASLEMKHLMKFVIL